MTVHFHFLSKLASTARAAAPAMEWRRMMGGEFASAAPFLRDTGRMATVTRCEHGCGCAHEVIEGGPPWRAVCVCEAGGGCPDIEPAPGDLDLFEVDIERLGRETARALNCRPGFAQSGTEGVWQIGAWSDQGIPVLMAAGLAPRELPGALARVTARLRSRLILIVPDASESGPLVRELLAHDRSGLFGLDAIARPAAPGRLRAARPPEEMFAAFTPGDATLDDGGVHRAFALIQKLEARSPSKPPGLVTVFKLYCMDELSALDVARKCGCAKSTVIERLGRIRKATGMNPCGFRSLKRDG